MIKTTTPIIPVKQSHPVYVNYSIYYDKYLLKFLVCRYLSLHISNLSTSLENKKRATQHAALHL